MSATMLEHTCPNCKTVLEAATCIDGPGAEPTEGDFSLCFSCGSWGVFQADLQLRPATKEEITEIYEIQPSLEALSKSIKMQT